MSAFLQIFQLMLGQKNAKSPWWRHSWTSVFHYLDPSLPLLKSGHKKLGMRSCKFVFYEVISLSPVGVHLTLAAH